MLRLAGQSRFKKITSLKKQFTSFKERYKLLKLLKRKGLTIPQAIFLATRKDFNPELLEKASDKNFAVKFAEKTDKALNEFLKSGYSHHHFFFKSKPTTEEFFSFLVIDKKLDPAKALYESLVRQTSSNYFKQHGFQTISSFSLKNWAKWKAERVADILFQRDFNREHSNEDRKQEVVADLANVFEKTVLNGETPRVELKIFWGGHNENGVGTATENDFKAISRFKNLVDSLQQIGVKASVGLLFSDFHSEKINGVERERIENYFKTLRPRAENLGFKVERLNNYWEKFNPFQKPNLEETIKALKLASEQLEILEKLGIVKTSAAIAHSELVKKGLELPEESEKKYNAVRIAENYMFNEYREKNPYTLFISFSDPKESKPTSPKHTLFFWSLGHGKGKPTWLR